MSLFPSIDRRPVYLDQSGQPMSYGRIFYYAVDGITKKTVYTDRALAVPAQNSQLLNIFGRTATEIFLGAGDYTMKSFRYIGTGSGAEPEGDPVWVSDNQWDDSGAATATAVLADMRTATVMQELRNITPLAGMAVTLLGYRVEGDKPSITYVWNPTSNQLENNGTFIKSYITGTGCWEWTPGSEVDARHFGLVPPAQGSLFYNSLWNDWVAYCTTFNKVGRLASANYPLSYTGSGITTLTVLFPLIVDQGVTISNLGTDALHLVVSDPGSTILIADPLKGVGSVGDVQFKFATQMGFDIDPRWFGYASGFDASAVYATMLPLVATTNTVVLNGSTIIGTWTGTTTIPVVRFVGDAVLSLGFTSPAKWVFTDALPAYSTAGGFDIAASGIADFNTCLSVPAVSWLASSCDLASTLLGSTRVWDIDVNSDLLTATTLDSIRTAGGILSCYGDLTLRAIEGTQAVFAAAIVGKRLIVTGMPLRPEWFYSQDTTLDWQFASAAAGSGVIDFSNIDSRTHNLTVDWDTGGRSLIVKGLKVDTSVFRMAPSGTAKTLTFVDCAISTSCTSEFLTGSVNKLAITGSTISCTALYSPGNPSSYGRICTSVAYPIEITNSILQASRLFEGTSAYLLVKGSQCYGTWSLGTTGNMQITGSNLGTSATIYFAGGAVKLSSGGFMNITGTSVQRDDLVVYSSNASVGSPKIASVLIDGVTFQPVGTGYPALKFIAQHASTAITDVNVNGCTYGFADSVSIASVATCAVSVTGSGSFSSVQGFNVANNTCTGYYKLYATKGEYMEEGGDIRPQRNQGHYDSRCTYTTHRSRDL